MKRFGAVVGLYVVLALAATHPLWQRLGDAVPGDVGDPVLNTYILAWDAHALVADPLNLFNANFFFPLPGTLAFSENLGGTALFALPLMLLSGEPVLTYNLMFLASFVLAGVGMYLLVLRITRRRAAAVAAGIAFAFAPYHLASLAHLQLLSVGWLPLLVLSFDNVLNPAGRMLPAFRTPTTSSEQMPAAAREPAEVAPEGARPRSSLVAGFTRQKVRARDRCAPGVLFAVFLWLQAASTLHGALFAALIVLVFAAAHWRRPGALLRREFVVPLAVCACLLLPIGVPYAAALDALRAARPPDVALSFSAQPSDFLAAYPGNRLFGALTAAQRERPGFSEEQTLFMGIVAPLLALAALGAGVARVRRAKGRRRDAASTGSDAGIGVRAESTAPGDGGGPAGSWRWTAFFVALALLAVLLASSGAVAQALPLAGIMRVPARWAGVLAFALAGLAGLGVAQIANGLERKWAGRAHIPIIVAACLAALLYGEGFAAPVPLAEVGTLRGQHAIYYLLAGLPGREAVLELPMYTGTKRESAESKRMVASTVHWRPLVNGYSGITPPQTLALAAQLAGFPDDASLAALRTLGRQGVRYIIVHAGEPGIPRRDWNQTNRARALAGGTLKLVQTIDDNDLMEIVNP